MAGLGNDEVLLCVAAPPSPRILEEHKDAGAVVVGMNKTPRVHKESPLAEIRKVMLHLETQHSLRSGNDFSDKLNEARECPIGHFLG